MQKVVNTKILKNNTFHQFRHSTTFGVAFHHPSGLTEYGMAEASILCIVSLIKSLASSSSILKYSSTQLLPPELLGTSHALISLHCRGSSTTLSISCTRDCRSSDFIAGGVLVSACRTSISLLHITFGRKKPGVARISGIFRVRLSLSM